MLRFALVVVGILSLFVGIAGFSRPHNVLPLSAGILAVCLGTEGSLPQARSFCRLLGAFYLLLGAVGHAWGKPGLVWLGDLRRDERAFAPLPGLLELGRRDHDIHLALGSAALAAGLAGKSRNTVRGGTHNG